MSEAKRLNDDRKALAMTVDEADDVFRRIAEAEIAMTAEAATLDVQMNSLKAKMDECKKYYEAKLQPLEAQLNDYILAHKDDFQKPRMRKHLMGEYGLRTVSNVEITDTLLARMTCLNNGIGIIVKETLDKKEIEKFMKQGHEFAGAEILSGEIAKYVVKKELLDEVKK